MSSSNWQYHQVSEKKNTYQVWFHHHKPILKYMYDGFIDICKREGLAIQKSRESEKDFYRMIYEESNGEKIDKRDYMAFYPDEFPNQE